MNNLCNKLSYCKTSVKIHTILVKQSIDTAQTDQITQYFGNYQIKSADSRKQLEESIQQVYQLHNYSFEVYSLLMNSVLKANIKGLLQTVFTKLFLQQFKGDDKQKGIQLWSEVPIECLPQYMQVFNLQANDINDAEMRINMLLHHKKLGDAIKLIIIFANTIPISQYIDKYIQCDQAVEFSKVCDQQPLIIPEFVSKLATSNNSSHLKLATELIKKHNLNKNDYKEMIVLQNKSAVENVYFKFIEEFHRAEERLEGYEFMLNHVVNKLLNAGMIDQAYSVVKRQQLKNYQLQGKYIDNPLLSRDGFGLTDSVCYGQDPSGFVQFADFGIEEGNIQFINTLEQLKQCEIALYNSDCVGFDSEFNHYFDEFNPGGVAILQLATRDTIFVIDTLALQQSEQFVEFLYKFFTSDLLKIGHSIKNDISEFEKQITFPQKCIPNNFIDLVTLFNQKVQQQQTSVSLSNQTYQLLGKQLSKKETFSNWARRPLRKCQMYYGAMDAYICIVLYDKLSVNAILQNEQPQAKQKKLVEQLQIIRDGNLRYDIKYQDLIVNKDMKFIVDRMLKKLVSHLRHLGIDTVYVEQGDHKLMEKQAIAEGRIIITRDKKFFEKQLSAPCFYVSDGLDTDDQYAELQRVLKFNTSDKLILSRCVKCNSEQIKQINSKTAEQFLDFQNNNQYETIKEFWQCQACQQIYWEGGQYRKSQERFHNLINKQQQ